MYGLCLVFVLLKKNRCKVRLGNLSGAEIARIKIASPSGAVHALRM